MTPDPPTPVDQNQQNVDLIETLRRERDEIAQLTADTIAIWAENWQEQKERAEAAEARCTALVEALREVDRANSHFGSGPHCTCSQSSREQIVHAALRPASGVDGGNSSKNRLLTKS